MNNIITDILKEYKDEIIAFASEVVKTKSLTCQEGEVASIIAGKMEELGYDEVTIDDMGNVLGRIGSGDAKLMFDSHMDTVVVNDEQLWSVPPFSGEIKDGKLYGRGASDMKCGLVASVFGAFAAKKAGLLGDGAIYVSASSMEEDYDGDAVKYLLNKTGLRPDGVVICEPTSLRIATGHRGRALIEVKAEGRGCHASTPELGKNPVYMLRPVIDCVEKLAEELSKRTGEHGSVALTNIYCTTASNNSVPQDATIILDRRLALGENLAAGSGFDEEAQSAARVDDVLLEQVFVGSHDGVHVHSQRGSMFAHAGNAGLVAILPGENLVADLVGYLLINGSVLLEYHKFVRI